MISQEKYQDKAPCLEITVANTESNQLVLNILHPKSDMIGAMDSTICHF